MWNAWSLMHAHLLYRFKSGCITWLLLCLSLAVRTCYATSQAENNIRSAPASSALTVVLHWSYSELTANHCVRAKEERNRVQRRTKVSFGRTMMQAPELQLAKGTWSNIEQWRNQGCIAIAIIELCLSESIGQSVSQSVSRKFC